MPDYGDYYNDFEEIEDYVVESDNYDNDNAQDLCIIFEREYHV